MTHEGGAHRVLKDVRGPGDLSAAGCEMGVRVLYGSRSQKRASLWAAT